MQAAGRLLLHRVFKSPTRSQHRLLVQLLSSPTVKQHGLQVQSKTLRTHSSSKQAGGVEPDPLSPEASRRNLRAILLRVHPDRLSSHQAQQQSNSEALKLLNSHLDHAAEGKRMDTFTLRFFIKTEPPAGGFKEVSVTMPGSGSLAPLFHAFGLISDAELLKAGPGGGAGGQGMRESMRDLLAWLAQHMAEVSRTRQQYAEQEAELHALKTAIQNRFQLFNLLVGRCWDDTSVPELHRRMAQLQALEGALLRLQGEGASFHGLKIHLRDSSDSDLAGGRRVHMDPIDGSVSVLAGSGTLDQELGSLDPSQARRLALSSENCDKMAEGLLAQAAGLLGVGTVRFPILDTIRPGHKSLVWVQRLLEDRLAIKAAMARCSTRHLSSITIVVHSDEHMRPHISPHIPTWLCVSSSSGTKDLLDFLCSEAGSEAAAGAHASRLSDEADAKLCDRVRKALGCRYVSTTISIHSSEPGHVWREAAQLLLDNSRLLRSSADLSSIFLRLGDKYEIDAELGMVTIPCDFDVEDLTVQLRRLVAPPPLRLQAPPAWEPPPPQLQGSAASAPPQEAPAPKRQGGSVWWSRWRGWLKL